MTEIDDSEELVKVTQMYTLSYSFKQRENIQIVSISID